MNFSHNDQQKKSAGILGGGISGLTVAYALQKKGFMVTVYEKASEVGGAIKTLNKTDWQVEEGPNTLLVKSPEIWALLRELELEPAIREANSKARRRYVVKNNRPIALPASIGNFLTTSLLSGKAKLRLLREPFITTAPEEDESIASFIRRRLGPEPLDYGVNPFVSGVYAGDPQTLSVKHTFSRLWQMEQEHGSLLKGMLFGSKNTAKTKKALISFTGGLQMLPNAMARSLGSSVRTSATVQSVSRRKNSWVVRGKQGKRSFRHNHALLISTLPVHQLERVFDDPPFAPLSDLPYTPLSMLAFGFRKEQVHHPLDGFGILIPAAENYRTLGALFSSTLFPGRAPEGHHLLTCFTGGARQPEWASRPASVLKARVLNELDTLLGIDGEPVFVHHRYWPNAIPQYQLGYDQYLDRMNAIEQQYPALFLCGNYRGGVSVPDCILSAFKTAQKASRFSATL